MQMSRARCAATGEEGNQMAFATPVLICAAAASFAADGVAQISAIEEDIAGIAERIVAGKGSGHGRIMKEIDSLTDKRVRWKLYERVKKGALAVRFDKIEELVARECPDAARRRSETFRRLHVAYGRVRSISEDVCASLLFSDQAVQDRWRPWFDHYVRMTEELARVHVEDESNGNPLRMELDAWARQIEDCMEAYLCVAGPLPPDDEAWFRRRFEEVVGRPPKTGSLRSSPAEP